VSDGELALPGAFALIAGLCALSALILIAMTFVFAQLIGWRALARRYRAPRCQGRRFSSSGVLIGAHSWNAPPLLVALDDHGITLLPRPPFRIAFAPFRIPWPLVTSFEPRAYLFFDVVELRFGNDAKSLVGFVPSKATEAIAARLAERGDMPLEGPKQA
jgi:hypothetical protein